MDGEVLLVGDAVSGFRPHTGPGTNQAAYHALLMVKVFGNDMEMGDAQEAIMEYARHMNDAKKRMGNWSQFGRDREQAWHSENSGGVKKDTD